MSFRPAKSVCLALLASLPACNQLEAIDATDSGGGGGGIPTAVRTAFTESCGKTGCHGETGPTKPPLAGTALDDILTGQGAGGPFVTLGDTANSYIAVKMLPDATLSALGLTRTGSRMPLDGDFTNPNNQTILAWIGGADFGDDSGGGGTTGGDMTGGSSGGTTGDPSAPTFTNVQAIFNQLCFCHNAAPDMLVNGNLSLQDGMAYANIVGVKSPTVAINLVEPGDPANSYLYLKLDGTYDKIPGAGGMKMPQGGMLSVEQLALVEAWITMGALDN